MRRLKFPTIWLAVISLGCLLPFAAIADGKTLSLKAKGKSVGTVTIEKSGDKLIVSLEADGKLGKLHVDVAGSVDDLRFNKAGKAKLGKFLFKGKGNRAVIDVSDMSGTVYVATRAMVSGHGKAWAGEDGEKWASFDLNGSVTEAATDEEPVVEAPPVVEVNSGLVQFKASSFVAQEATGSGTITVERSGGTDGPITVNFETVALADGGALEGMDYVPASGPIYFRDGESSAQITVQVVNDGMAEGQESFGLRLSGDCCLGSTVETRIIIEDAPVAEATVGDEPTLMDPMLMDPMMQLP